MIRLPFALLALALTTPLLAAPAQETPYRDLSLSAAERQACETQGGWVERAGMLNNEICVMRHADAGKVCKSQTDCSGRCLLDDAKAPADLNPGKRAAGRCEATTNIFGCQTMIENGRVAGQMCAD